ncbi:MAG: HRDC domain-containing protein [Candidatus Marinimicrobia bacterium]|nr:HRDC domain-containing protein [Candidatus Neomarinimicrobiota bacterium]
MNDIIKRIVTDYENAICSIILYCLSELPFTLGIKKTISVLKGSKSSFIINHQLNELSTYALLSNFSGNQLRIIIESLIENEFITVSFIDESQNIPVLELSQKDNQFFSGNNTIDFSFLDKLIDKSIIELNESEQILFDKLKILRREISSKKDIPAFMVCGDSVLREISANRPLDKESLLLIKGVGEKFAEQYSDLFLNEIILNQQENNDNSEDLSTRNT